MRKPGARKAAYSGVSNPDERSATAPDRAAELHRQLVEARIVSSQRAHASTASSCKRLFIM